MPGTHFAAGWLGGPFLPVPMAGLELTSLMLPILLYQLSYQDTTETMQH